MKKYRHLIQVDSDFYRLVNPFEKKDTAWMVVSRDKNQAIAAYYQSLNKVNPSFLRLRLEGLDSDKLYEVTYHSGIANEDPIVIICAYGDQLMEAGIPLNRFNFYRLGGDFTSVLFTLKAVEGKTCYNETEVTKFVFPEHF